MVVGDSSLTGDREVCSSHLSSPPWPPRGWWVPGPPAAWGASMQYVHFRPLVGRQKLLMCSLLLSLMDLLLSFALVLFPATKQRESLTLGAAWDFYGLEIMQNEMGYRWGQLEHSVAGAFQNGALNMHGWSCTESWLQNDLVTADIPFSFSSSHHQAHFGHKSATGSARHLYL